MKHPLFYVLIVVSILSVGYSMEVNSLVETTENVPFAQNELKAYDIVEFADGLVHGLQRYENQTSMCGTNVLRIQNIVNDAIAIYNDFMAGKFTPSKFMVFVYNSWSILNIIEDTCHFYELVTDMISLLNPIALVFRLAYIVLIGSWTIIPSFVRFMVAIFQAESFTAGLNAGRILKVAFSYEIE
eukprot:CAMPEP_0168326860 /NCGR_PEP_ID=MMETSP0213-20121227/5561_1 /TAXON_ID=151035 /ORGANISM="Euplotes harpa, Strain FSP1.4" /LENGTH=184 /DNA_ID=CAMNT_0008329669 /DNA_START=15 /DNA_END=569 /DNA_ORIENTATION=-